ncbi:MAG: hypothetical protein FDZ69_00215 [Deltaproteobacteria bacterium]|nr:MAG: hypothetical protein FDZ69_00215 [Deltaproteobacteria bacterium]
MDSIFWLADDGVGLMVLELVPFLGTPPYRWKRVAVADLALRFRDAQRFNGAQVAAELLAVLAVIASEPEQRELVARKSGRRVRQIKLGGQPVSWHLRRMMNRDATPYRTKGDLRVLDEEFDSVVAKTMGAIKAALGLPVVNPVAYSYPVSDDVIASTTNPDLRNHLMSLTGGGPVMTGQMDVVCNRIRDIGPADDAEQVIEMLLAGGIREHLSAVSVSAKGRNPWVTIVNPKGIILKLPARKFEALIDDVGQTKRIGEIDTRDINGGLPEVEINVPMEIKVVAGHYESATSTLHVVGLAERTLEVAFSTSFLLDADSAVCVYLALRRQRLDRQRFERLMDEAETKLSVDPFRHLQDRRPDS